MPVTVDVLLNFPPPPASQTDENDGDDAEDNDADVFLPRGYSSVTVGGMLPLLLCCSALRQLQRSLCLYASKACLARCSFVDCRNLYRPLSFCAQFRLGA